MKRSAIGSPKLAHLQSTLGLRLYEACGLLECLWLTAERHCQDGAIGRFADDAIAGAVGWPVERAGELIEGLVATRWLDRIDGDVRLTVHHWPAHCERTVHWVLARAHRLFADGTVPSLSGLSARESEEIRRWRAENGADVCGNARASEPKHTDAQESAFMCVDAQKSALPRPSPSPSPSPSPEKPQPICRPGVDAPAAATTTAAPESPDLPGVPVKSEATSTARGEALSEDGIRLEAEACRSTIWVGELWNAVVVGPNQAFAAVKSWTRKRHAAAAACVSILGSDREVWRVALARVPEDLWLSGRKPSGTHPGWVASLDFILGATRKPVTTEQAVRLFEGTWGKRPLGATSSGWEASFRTTPVVPAGELLPDDGESDGLDFLGPKRATA